MKKVLICMFTFISSSIYSQEINFGIKGGLNLSNGSFSGSSNMSMSISSAKVTCLVAVISISGPSVVDFTVDINSLARL